MKIFVLFIIGIISASAHGGDPEGGEENEFMKDITAKEEEMLNESLLEGLLDGLTFSLDCVTMSKHDHDENEPTEKQLKKEHENNVKQAKLEAKYMTKHRPMESKEVKAKEAALFTKLNILLHYLNSRGQTWALKEPKELGFEENDEKHMVFESEKNDAAEIKIPKNLFYTVGNMKKSIPPHSDGKKPILLTCLESFIVSRLGFLSMQGLSKSEAPVEVKLEYMGRWIKIAKNHYILYLPYISLTAPRCHDLLKSENSDELKVLYEDNTHYKHLLSVCKEMVKKRNDDGMLQTYVMLDSDLHPELMRKAIDDKHLFPLLLQEKDNSLKTIHEHHQHEMTWDEFQSAGNMVLAELEQQVLNKSDLFLKPENWGIGLKGEDAKKAEMELIKLYVKSQKLLNLKVIQTVRDISHQSLHKSKKGDEDFKKSMLKFSQKEEEAAKKEANKDDIMRKCMEGAKEKVEEDLREYKNSSITDIANKLKTFEHDSWMECVSSRIFSKLLEVCDNEDYCKAVMGKLDDALKNADPDSTSTIAMENFLYALTTALLQKDKLGVPYVKEHILKLAKQEIQDASEPAKPAHHQKAEAKTEGENGGEGSKQEDKGEENAGPSPE